MPAFLPWALPLGVSLLGGLFGKKNPQQQQQQSSTNTSSGTGSSTSNTDFSNWLNNMFNQSSQTRQQNRFSSTSNPFITAPYRGMESVLRGNIMNRLRSGSGLPAGFASMGLQRVNEAADAGEEQVRNRLAEAGLSGSPAEAGAIEKAATGRAGMINDFRAQLPMLERQMSNEDMQMAGMLMEQFGKGQQQQGTSEGISQTDASGMGSQQGGGMSNTVGSNIFNQSGSSSGTGTMTPPQGNIWDALGGMGPLLAMLAGQGAFGGGRPMSPGQPNKVWV